MAKALTGYLPSSLHGDQRVASIAVENARLRRRVNDLEALVSRLQRDNDALLAARAADLLDAPLEVPADDLQPV